jgi:hypothetical protein
VLILNGIYNSVCAAVLFVCNVLLLKPCAFQTGGRQKIMTVKLMCHGHGAKCGCCVKWFTVNMIIVNL